ncbi:MAG: FAD-dependent oxidoreductase [Alphaproteobacteria bacterium]|nr:MAG: FAD-dependent oxidoreductase [Alphaproteobacteria bacterium]
MTSKVGKTAIVVGAGMAGLSAAAALADRFAEVLVLDRDTLPEDASWRMGAGQGAHLHQLLKAGEQSLEKLLPGITKDFYTAGAVDMLVGRDVKVFDFGGWMDECDAGFSVTSLSRPVYEGVLRKRVAALPGVTIRHETDVARLAVENGVCTGVELSDGAKLSANLVVDASGMNGPMMAQLVEDGHAAFETEHVKINVAYTTARFRKPDKYKGEQTGYFFLPAPPGKAFGFILAVSEVKTFRKPTATRRKIWEAAKWPDNLLPFGDTLSSVNPTYGQGMTVAAVEAEALAGMLDARGANGAGLGGLAKEYLTAAADISGRAWSLSVNSDYVYPETEGERPATYAMNRALASTLRKLADEDLEFRVARYRLVHMVDPASALREGPLALRFFTALQGSMS